MGFDNILKAIKSEGLTPTERMENYDLLERLNAEGRKLSDILKQAEGPSEDPALFEIMETEVKDTETVVTARDRLRQVKTDVIVKLCSQYPEYRTAAEAYRIAVREAYKNRIKP